jgi:hypothetical protein
MGWVYQAIGKPPEYEIYSFGDNKLLFIDD